MRKIQFSDGDTVKILVEADKAPVAEVAKKYGVAEHPTHHLDAVFGPLGVDALVRRPDSTGTRLCGHR